MFTMSVKLVRTEKGGFSTLLSKAATTSLPPDRPVIGWSRERLAEQDESQIMTVQGKSLGQFEVEKESERESARESE